MILVGHDKFVSDWVREHLPMRVQDFGPHSAVGFTHGGQLIAGVVFRNYNEHDVEIVVAATSAKWCTRLNLRILFDYIYNQLGCVRCTCIIGQHNKRSRKLAKGLGFRLEGVVRKGYDGKADAIVYGLLRGECMYLRPMRRFRKAA